MAFLGDVSAPLELGSWMLCAATALSMALNSGKLVGMVRGKPPAEALGATTEMLTRRVDNLEQTLERSRSQIEELRREVKADMVSLAHDNEERASKLHHRLDTILAAVSRIQGRIDKNPDEC